MPQVLSPTLFNILVYDVTKNQGSEQEIFSGIQKLRTGLFSFLQSH